jgi:hypothetical protein
METRGVLVGCALIVVACGTAAERRGFETAVAPAAPDDAGADASTIPPGFGDAAAADAASAYESMDPVDVVFTADNAYAFGWGTETTLSNFESRPNTMQAGDIFNCPVVTKGAACNAPNGCGPEAYQVPAADAPSTAFLYVVAWSDQGTTQGALGQFRRGTAETLHTGDDAWEVCATGVEHSPTDPSDTGPSKQDVEEKIALCNDGDEGVASHGWVDKNGAVTPGALGNLAVGEDNARGRTTDPGGLASDGVFPITCQVDANGTPGIDPDAHWMWYQPPGFSTEQSFTDNSGNATKTYLIFRVRAKDIPITPVN